MICKIHDICNKIIVPDRRRLVCADVICVHRNHLCGREGGKKGAMGLSKGTKNGAVDSEHWATIPSKRVIHTLKGQ